MVNRQDITQGPATDAIVPGETAGNVQVSLDRRTGLRIYDAPVCTDTCNGRDLDFRLKDPEYDWPSHDGSSGDDDPLEGLYQTYS